MRIKRSLRFQRCVLRQKFLKRVLRVRVGFSEPSQGRHRVAQGISPGLGLATHGAVGYMLPPVGRRAQFFNELPTHDTYGLRTFSVPLSRAALRRRVGNLLRISDGAVVCSA